MNKFKLFALAVCAMLSTNAFAEDAATNYVVKDGLIYRVKTEAVPAEGEKSAKPGTVELAGIADNTKGNAFKTSKKILVLPTIKVTVDDEDKDYDVVGIDASWETAEIAKPKSLMTLSTVIETLSIDITNFTTALASTAYDGFTKLTSLTIVDKTVVPTGKTAVTTELPAVSNPALTTLDFAETNITKMPLFKNNATIVTVKLSKAMKVIPIDEFYGASKLKTVVLPTNLETISGGAFQECAALEGTFEIPATVKEIRKYAFLNAAKADIDLSKAAALEFIGEGAFQGSGITTANLNASVKLLSIGENAFNGCEKLAKLQMSGLSKGKLEKIGIKAFYGTAITAANIPATVKTIGVAAFANCKSLTQVSAMAGLEAIPNYLFQDCEKLAAVSINEAATSIGDGAFEGCKDLAKVTIKTNEKTGKSALKSLGIRAFNGCEALESIDLSATQISIINGNSDAQFLGCKALKEVKVPATLEKIHAQAFGDCVIENLDLSETKIIQLNAIFRYSDGTYPTAEKPYASLESIKLPEGLTSIWNYSGSKNGVFQYCTGLTEITIPEGVTEVYPYTFQYCTALETATVSDGKVDAKAFWYCDKLKTFNYLDTDITNDEGETAKYVLNDAFLGCTPFIKFVTTGTYQKAHPTAPTNTKYGTSANATMKTVWEGVEGAVKAYGIFENTTGLNVIVKKSDDLKLYSIYVDQGTAYFQALKFVDGQFVIAPKAHVILKTDAPKDNIEYTTATIEEGERTSVLVDEVVSLNWGGEIYGVATKEIPTPFGGITDKTYPLADFQSDYVRPGEYVYRLTNNGGFGFKFFTGTEMKAGQFFIVSTKAPTSAARLQTVWLDEDGNVEGDATGIQQVDAAEAQDGAIYNLQGVRVNAAKKGLYIQNGKKFIVK